MGDIHSEKIFHSPQLVVNELRWNASYTMHSKKNGPNECDTINDVKLSRAFRRPTRNRHIDRPPTPACQ